MGLNFERLECSALKMIYLASKNSYRLLKNLYITSQNLIEKLVTKTLILAFSGADPGLKFGEGH